jgi:hypothetical protein
VNAKGIPAGDILVVAVETTISGGTQYSLSSAGLTAAPAPACVSLSAVPVPPGSQASANGWRKRPSSQCPGEPPRPPGIAYGSVHAQPWACTSTPPGAGASWTGYPTPGNADRHASAPVPSRYAFSAD